MATDASSEAMHRVLSKKLPGLKNADLKAVATTIANLQSLGLRVDDVFPEGIVQPDSITIGGNLDPSDLQNLNLGDLVSLAGDLKNIQIFPLGIPGNADIMRVQLTVHR